MSLGWLLNGYRKKNLNYKDIPSSVKVFRISTCDLATRVVTGVEFTV
jgi:hypothetical protein